MFIWNGSFYNNHITRESDIPYYKYNPQSETNKIILVGIGALMTKWFRSL